MMWVDVFDSIHVLWESKWHLLFYPGAPQFLFEVQLGFYWCSRKVKQKLANIVMFKVKKLIKMIKKTH